MIFLQNEGRTPIGYLDLEETGKNGPETLRGEPRISVTRISNCPHVVFLLVSK